MSETFKYDVAFSFLSQDASLAQRLADAIAPTLATFVFSRQKEALLGQDGMEPFASVFGSDARLTVILHRQGWGNTDWTAFEESHIKARALRSHMKSFMVVRLDDTDLPAWVPDTHLYASIETDSEDEIVGIIRARARQEGAAARPETAAEFAVRRSREQAAARAREERAASHKAVAEVRAEVSRLYAEMDRILTAIKSADPSIEFQYGGGELGFGIAAARRSIHVSWESQHDNTIRDSCLFVHDWAGRIRLPTSLVEAAGSNWKGARAYVPQLSAGDQWEWRREPSRDASRSSALVIVGGTKSEVHSSSALADKIVRRFFEGLSD
jgi:hypothetical protein